MKKALIIVFILSLSACRKDGQFLYEVIDFEINNAVNSSNKTNFTNTSPISKKSYAIGIEYSMEHKGQINGGGNIRETGYKNEYDVESFKIYSLTSYDSLHPAGSDISEYFLYSDGSSYSSGNTIKALIKNSKIGNGNYGEDDETWKSEQFLIMMIPPEINGIYRFVVEISQSNGITLSDTLTVTLVS